ncbi:hypothetical protein JYG30_25590 (plasmid) [Fibrella sp. USSR17]
MNPFRMVPSPVTDRQPPSISVAYLLLLYRQINPARSRVSGRSIQTYLDFCLAYQLRIGPWSCLLFAEQTGGRTAPGLVHWLLFYEQIGSPPLLTPICLAASVSLGAYPVADLVRFWQWHHRGTSDPRIKAIRVALFRWLTFQRDAERTGAVCIDDISEFLAWLGQRGWGTLAIGHQLLAIRQWANWLWQCRTGLDLTLHQKALLRQVGQLTWDEGYGFLTPLAVSPDWHTLVYSYRVDVAAPAIEALLNRGIPLGQIASLQLNQLRFRYVDDVLVQIHRRSWTLSGNQARALRRYLEAGDRWGFCWSLPQQPLFIETDWATLWALARQWLGQARLERRLSQNQNRHSPAWLTMNWPELFDRPLA